MEPLSAVFPKETELLLIQLSDSWPTLIPFLFQLMTSCLILDGDQARGELFLADNNENKKIEHENGPAEQRGEVSQAH